MESLSHSFGGEVSTSKQERCLAGTSLGAPPRQSSEQASGRQGHMTHGHEQRRDRGQDREVPLSLVILFKKERRLERWLK